MKKKYKTSRKYPCPYCDKKLTRGDLIDHVLDDHEMMIPEDYSAARVVYDSINKKNYGTCMVCGAKVYEWDPNICRYKNICNDPKCMEAVRQKAKGNHLDDPEKQKKMLAGRKISGSYKFSDGTVHTYVGSYEKKALEFMDKGLNIPGKDILTPGPVIEYNYNGENHTWILDILYVPAMLAIDCKDGGNNPNTRPMQSYREKQLAKENAIAKDGRYNYLRLTDNNFGQLLSALADIKYGIINSDPEMGIYIHEDTIDESIPGGMPRADCKNYYIIPYYIKGMNTDDNYGFAFGNTAMDSIFHFDKEGNMIKEDDPDKFLEGKEYKQIFFKNRDLSNVKTISEASILEALLGHPYTSMVDFVFCEDAFIVENQTESVKAIRQGLIRKFNLINKDQVLLEYVVKTRGNVFIMKDEEGYFITTPEDYVLCSDKYNSLEFITDDMIKLYNDLYEKNRGITDAF